MANSTRLKIMDVQIKKLGDTTSSLLNRQDLLQSSMDLQQKTLREILLQLGSLKERLDSPPSPSPLVSTSSLSTSIPPLEQSAFKALILSLFPPLSSQSSFQPNLIGWIFPILMVKM